VSAGSRRKRERIDPARSASTWGRGHQAGYDWAESHGISDEADCTGSSQSFVEGCRTFVREQQAEPSE